MQNLLQSNVYTSAFSPTKKALRRTILLVNLLATLLLIILYITTPFGEFLDLKATDFLLNYKVTQPEKAETVTVAIDDNSLSQYGQWPWPRYRLAMLLDKIQQSGAKIIAVNILFPEQDRTSPIHWQKTIFNDLGYELNTSALPKTLLDHDLYLANTLLHGKYVLGYELLFHQPEISKNQCNPHPLSLHETSASPHMLYEAKGILCNNQTLLNSATASGFFNGAPDSDGILRRLPLLLNFKNQTYPSFALETFLKSKNISEISIKNGRLGTHYIIPENIPIDRKGNYLLRQAPASEKHISAVTVLNNKFEPAVFTDKIVFIGITASGIAQKYHFASGIDIAMIDIHKLIYESLITNQHSVRGDFFWTIELLLTFILTTIIALLTIRLSTTGLCTILVPTLCLLGLASVYISKQWDLLFLPLFPGVCLILNTFLLITIKYRYFQKTSASEAKQALLLLESSQANLQSILNTIPDIVFRLDTRGNIIFISSAIEKYQKHHTPLLGRSIYDLVVPEDVKKAQYKLNERRTGSRATHDLEVRLRLYTEKDEKSTVRYFSVAAAGLYKGNQEDSQQFIGTQGIVKDITKRKRIEHQLFQAKKMETIGNLAAGIAHDLNNILSGVVSYPDMILADLSEDDPLYSKISLVKKSGQKAAFIVQDLLTLARRNILQSEVLDLNTIIRDYLESTEHNQAKKNHPFVTIQTKLAESPVSTTGSSIHISKVVMNLINNAMEAIPTDGNVNISTSKVELKQTITGYENIPPGTYACMSIRDTGPGIPESDIQKIFEPFYSKKPVHSKGGGLGLGMTIIWATIKDHHGYIDISSSENFGTTITIYLPETDQAMCSNTKQASLDCYKGKETILVIDDLEEQLAIASNMLEKFGYNALTSQNGSEALDLLSRSQVDLVILDMIMPGHLGGLETYQKILQLYPGQKAIIASGYSESAQVGRMQKMGAGGYIQKPYSMEELVRAVRTELDRNP